MDEWIIQFWNENTGSIIVSFVVGFIFFVLGPLGLWFSGKRIRRERIRKAKEMLLDLLEGMVVNQSNIDERKLMSVFLAVEREIDIDLNGVYSINDWLGDVVLRFEKSRHLGAEPKQKYYDEVSRISEEIRANKENKIKVAVPRKYEEIIENLRASIKTAETDNALSSLKELEEKLSEGSHAQDPFANIFRMYYRMYKRSPFTFFVLIIIAIAIYALLLMKILPIFK